ncbi:hypothetical protein [Algihabitans albus]|uniref:hypothetical protein n=1 Tax=Algihabitans albus TaxID=2164067 RepID=UPI000E5D8CCD|nr:hypothetical protein [Algihabitans albus]
MAIKASAIVATLTVLLGTGGLSPVWAGEADVVAARLSLQGDGRYTAEVTVRHADTGWDHYADLWEVLSPNGDLLGARTLHHPHVEEQPFTRSLRDLEIPVGIDRVIVRARDSEHGFGGAELTIDVPR